MREDDDFRDRRDREEAEPAAGNWWEGPPPAGYTGPWPPQLAPGAHYGPLFGQIIYDQPTPIEDIPGYTGDPNDPTKSPFYHPEWWGNSPQPPTPQPPGPPQPPAPGPPKPGPGVPGGFDFGSLLAPWNGSFTPPNYLPYEEFPVFPDIPDFVAPTYEEAQNDPGYKFGRDEGLRAISNSRAAQGLWASGATGKAFQTFADNLASTHYGDIFQRNLGSYLTNVDTQYVKPFEAKYRRSYDLNAFRQRQNEMDYSNAYTRFLDDYNRFRTERNDRWNIVQPFVFD